ncbi:hypothetical protein Tco_0251926 [Tanacetum coccineum]
MDTMFYLQKVGHFVKECRKAKRVKDYEYHKEKMLLCKKEAKGIPLCTKQSEWLQDTDDEPDEQELEAHYMYIAKIQEVLHTTHYNSGPTYDVEPLEKVYPRDDYSVFTTERQHSKQPESINDTYVVEKVDSNAIHNSSHMSTNGQKADQNAKEPDDKRELEKNKRSLKDCKIDLERYLKKAQWEKLCFYIVQDDKNDLANLFAPQSDETIRLAESIENDDLKAQLQDKTNVNAEMRNLLNKTKEKSVDNKFEKPSIFQQPNAFRFQKPSVMGNSSPFSKSLERHFI